ncbi:MAG: Glycosyl transferase, group 1 [uncultured bacterium]|nr:MAG: Glycosyl transferase, group 1 [uncultured bacterium]HBH17582.1 glycosyl transferase family 1 [Cyanobacteria bacterium UBA9579]
MKIAVVGSRGVPATFGGIEKHCEEIYSRLVKIGHAVTIYARKGYIDESIKEYKGIEIKPLWTFKSKHLEATFHTFWALLHAVFSDADIIHFHAQGPCLFAWLPKLLAPDKKLIFTCHGIDWQRNKWNPLASGIIRLGEIFSATLFDTQITVSQALEMYYRNKYNINSITIINGVTITHTKEPEEIKEKFGLEEKEYLLFVGRLVPEKAPHKLIEAFRQIHTDKKLVIVGDSASTDDYVAHLKNLAKGDDRIIFTSYLYGEALREIYSNAYLYVSTSELEGLPLTLLEAMSYGIPTLSSPIAPHVEVIGNNEDFGYLFKSEKLSDIKEKLEQLLNQPALNLIRMGLKGQDRIRIQHNWDTIAKKLEIAYNFTRRHKNTDKLTSAIRRHFALT